MVWGGCAERKSFFSRLFRSYRLTPRPFFKQLIGLLHDVALKLQPVDVAPK